LTDQRKCSSDSRWICLLAAQPSGTGDGLGLEAPGEEAEAPGCWAGTSDAPAMMMLLLFFSDVCQRVFVTRRGL
jgi:hypothetical protein